MNLYLRYFDKEALVYNADEAVDFLKSIPEIGVDEALETDIREYAASEVYYPKRYKVRPCNCLSSLSPYPLSSNVPSFFKAVV